MLEKTILNDFLIKDILKSKYLIDVKQVEKIKLGSSNLFKIISDQGLYILKEYESKYNIEDVDREAKATNYLKECGIPTSEFIKTIDRSFTYEINKKIISIQKYIEGRNPKSNSASYYQLMQSAEYLGKITYLLKDKEEFNNYSKRNIITQENFDKVICDYNKMIIEYKNLNDEYLAQDVIAELKMKIEMIKVIRQNEYVMSKVKKVTISNTHGDYTRMQCLYNKDDRLEAILDFTEIGSNPVVWEIIRSYSYDDKKCVDGQFNIDNFIDYVKHFCIFFPLTKIDLEMMPYIYIIRLLTSTHGYKQYFENVVDPDTLLLHARNRTKICKWLFKNTEILSRRLVLEVQI